MADPRIELLDELIEFTDDIQGMKLQLPDGQHVWLHTTAQVEEWLKRERVQLQRNIDNGGRADG